MVCRQDYLNSADAIVSPSTFSPNTASYFDSPPPYTKNALQKINYLENTEDIKTLS